MVWRDFIYEALRINRHEQPTPGKKQEREEEGEEEEEREVEEL